MKPLTLARLIVTVATAAVLSCGCASGGTSPLVPPVGPSDGHVAAGSPEERLPLDPRFRGFTNPGEFDGEARKPPFLHPHYSLPEYDRSLFGWFTDPAKELDPLTFTCTVDEKTDLYSSLTYRVEYLPYGGLKYHWDCEIPEELLDRRRHITDLQITSFGGYIHRFLGAPLLIPFEPPGIASVIYPWRDPTLLPELQVPDPLRVLVFLSGQLRPEWEDACASAAAWSIEGVDGPLKVDLDARNLFVVLHLHEPLSHATTLHFGPVVLEEDLFAEDSEVIIIRGQTLGGEECECSGLDARWLCGPHLYKEAEEYARAYQIDEPEGCNIWMPYHCHDRQPIVHIPYLDFWTDEDIEEYGDWETYNYDPCLVFNTEATYTPGSHANHIYTWVFEASCTDEFGNPSSWNGVLHSEFMNADKYNPEFSEDSPRIAYGPQAAEWLQDKLDQWGDRAHPGPFLTDEYISGLAEDICGAYLLIDVCDRSLEPHAVTGVNIDYIDGQGNIYINESGFVSLGAELWIDCWDPTFNLEFDEDWPDPDCCPLPEDAEYYFEELVRVVNIDDILLTNPQAIRVRVADRRWNWARSGNVLDEPFGSHDVADLVFLGERYEQQQYEERRVECDGYVEPRLTGGATLELYALVIAAELAPPHWILTTINAPADQNSGQGGTLPIKVYLYRLDLLRSDPQWCDIYEEFDYESVDCSNFNPNAYCGRHIYGRGNVLWYDVNTHQYVPAYAPPVVVSDTVGPIAPPSPSDLMTVPHLRVTSYDTDAGNEDFRDYSIGVAADSHFNSSWFDQLTYECHYGTGNRGRYDTDACDSEEKQDNYRRNVLTFGQEYVKAECEDEIAYYAVESEADIMFIFAHGGYSAAVASPILGPFRDSPWDPFPYPWPPNDIQHLWDWAIQPRMWRETAFDLTRDAEWLALIACNTISPQANIGWRSLIDPDRLDSVLGFRDRLFTDIDDPNLSFVGHWYFRYFIGDFCTKLESAEYPGHSDYWDNKYHIAEDKAIRCWMEAALENYLYLKELQSEHTDWTEVKASTILIAAAIDQFYTYIIADEDKDGVFLIYRKDW